LNNFEIEVGDADFTTFLFVIIVPFTFGQIDWTENGPTISGNCSESVLKILISIKKDYGNVLAYYRFDAKSDRFNIATI
jgi:hypothetical protein